jgi:hypothetical protein
MSQLNRRRKSFMASSLLQLIKRSADSPVSRFAVAGSLAATSVGVVEAAWMSISISGMTSTAHEKPHRFDSTWVGGKRLSFVAGRRGFREQLDGLTDHRLK